jgi:hypothetical protein
MGAAYTIIGKKDPTVKLVADLTTKMFDREDVLDSLDQTYELIAAYLNGTKYHASFFQHRGVQVIVKIMEQWREDEVILRSCCRVIMPLARNAALADQLRVVGARTALETAIENNKLDDFIQRDGLEALTAINKVGLSRALAEIDEGCRQEDPSRVMQQMVDHPRKPEVHTHAFTELRKLAADDELVGAVAAAKTTPAAVGAFADTSNGILVIIAAINNLRSQAAVQAKGFQLLHCFCRDVKWNSLVGKAEAVRAAVATYNKYDNPPDLEVQQWVLWLLATMCKVPNNRQRMDRDGVKLILRNLAKEEKKRKEALAKTPGASAERKMLWRLVPNDLRHCWTRAELFEDFDPGPPGDFAEGDAIFYNYSVIAHPVNKRHLPNTKKTRR